MKQIIIKLAYGIILLLMVTERLEAQNVSISTNAVDWANFGTVNVETGVGVAQHISLLVGGHYNPWEFQTGKGYRLHNQQATGYFGVRWWPWYVFSGWWIGAKMQFSSFSRTGIWRPALEEGKSLGAGLSFGYTLMIHKNINIDFGAGFWGGRHLEYSLYECPECMSIRERGARYFIAPDDLSVSISFVF